MFIHPFSHHFASLITELKIYLAWAISHQYFNTWKLLAFKTFNHSRMNAKISEIPFPRASPDIHVWSCQILSLSDFGNQSKIIDKFALLIFWKKFLHQWHSHSKQRIIQRKIWESWKFFFPKLLQIFIYECAKFWVSDTLVTGPK